MKFFSRIFIFAFMLIPWLTFGQDANIELTNLVLENNKLIIYYNITNADKKQTFEVWPLITTENGKKLNAKSLSGDYGKGVEGGNLKKIVWDYNADGVVVDGNINVEMTASISFKENYTSIGEAMLLSAIVPGFGLAKLEHKSSYLLSGLAFYGFLAGSFYYSFSADASNSMYNSLASTQLIENSDANKYYDDAQKYERLSKVSGIAAGSIWLGTMIWTLVKAKKANSFVNRDLRKTLFYTKIDPNKRTIGFTFKYTF